MRDLTRFVACFVLFLGGVSAQSTDVQLLVRQQSVAALTLEPAAKLKLRGYVPESLWLGSGNYTLGERSFEMTRGEVLEVAREYVRLTSFGGKERWKVERAEVRVAGPSQRGPRLLYPSRIVLPRAGGGLVGLERASGRVVWQQPDVPCEMLAYDDELVFVAGLVDRKPSLAACSWRNGARAFVAKLGKPAVRLVPGTHGVAVVHDGGFTVRDRSGPELFAVSGAVHGVCAAGEGGGRSRVAWFAFVGAEIRAFDASGEVLWRKPYVRNDTLQLCTTSSGDLLVAEYCTFSDSGFLATCYGRDDGETLWRRRATGLLVDHSKYRHRLYVRPLKDRLVFVSQASGGDFAVALRPEDGEQLDREEWTKW